MRQVKVIIDMPWDKKRTLKGYIFDSYYGGKRISFTFSKIQKRYPGYFENQAELTKWIEVNSPKFKT
jgi:hypothetical protein